MKLEETMSRLPESLRGRLISHPLIADRLSAERPLEKALDRVWARKWTANATPAARDMLKWLLRRFGARPFAEAEAESLAFTEMEGLWTGAELRVALLRLRLDGILFAARKRWGDRLLYLPSDLVGLWHSVLYADELVPLEHEDEERLTAVPSHGRSPLSIRLLKTWAGIRHRGFPLTAKGVPHKANVARLAAAMETASDELRPLAGSAAEEGAMPPAPLALAIELGIELGILGRGPRSVEAFSGEGLGWLDGTTEDLDSVLHSMIVNRYAPLEPGLHFAALSLSGLEPRQWYREKDLLHAFGLSNRNSREAGWDEWIRLAAGFGWLEQGHIGGERTLRWRIDPAISLSMHPPASRMTEREPVYLQSDLELIVPPGVPFRVLWQLEEVCERIALDTVSTYRLTRNSCERARRLGYTLERIVDVLERATQEPIPGMVRGALEDWHRGSPSSAADSVAIADRDTGGEPELFHWLPRPDPLRDYELDGSFPHQGELFPGLPSVPAAWLAQSRSYHVSTRKDMVERALAWRTSLRIGTEEDEIAFIPERMERRGESWTVVGRARAGNADSPAKAEIVELPMDRINEIKLELPSPY
ncbi:helicase-associated domain-containing protein [Cohnella thailandensis]|uniref:Helicase-associated domain-containing protein n=1 Tax=Cohnella thailandensis TaxID=557557 RepID=A0A841SX01_9BACL|nr:helicase-associated domain-containing protein [Cohnella thailandensis]MBB6636444.1 helicase-associated domain-containing protein [Cohnella thailandensis]MBP1973585.1 hypothetical protein [Cohnella thailandensis]